MPHLTADPQSVEAGPWTFEVGDRSVPLGPALVEWDPTVPIHASRDLNVDLSELLSSCALPVETPILFSVLLESTGNGLRLGTAGTAIDDGLNSLELTVNGGTCCGSIRLTSCLLLAQDRSPEHPIEPHLAGAILWGDRFSTSLEGEAGQFPVTMVDFESAGYPAKAAWQLEWNPANLEVPVLGGMRLLINSGHPVMAELSQRPERDPLRMSVFASMRYDIALNLVQGALAADDVDPRDGDRFADDTVGALLQRFLGTQLSESDPAALRSRRDLSPGEFHALIQQATGFLGDING